MTQDRLTSLDIACGLVLPFPRASGGRRSVGLENRAQSAGRPALSARQALEHAIMPALLRPPCLVSFSGGRDSAAVLAVATALARREGLPLPIPATNVFTAAPDADESFWQELVVRHLGIEDWLRIEHQDELDLIGPYAQRVLLRYGVLAPANTHFHLPLLDAAPGGSLLTGAGGDELYSAARQLRGSAVLAGEVRPRPRDVLSVGFTLAPSRLRRPVINRRAGMEISWLRKRAMRRVAVLLADEAAAEPWRLPERVSWWRQRRYLTMGVHSMQRLGDDADVMVGNPLLAAPFWAAAARESGRTGFSGRTEGVRSLFGDLLPPELVSRRSKADFDQVFWTERSRTFARKWNGRGVPSEWVDGDRLAEHWRGASPSAPSGLMLQAAWLASARDRVDETVKPLGQGSPIAWSGQR